MSKRFLKNIALSVASIIIFFACAEVLTRIFWNDVTPESYKGVLLKGENRNFEKDGVLYKTNSLGIRNKEISFKKLTNTKRILALGDSYIWGDGLHESELITVKLEKQLDSLFEKRIEVINAGIAAFNTKDEYHQLIRLLPIYKPDLVILFFFTNDLLTKNDTKQYISWKVKTNMFLRANSKFYAFMYYVIKGSLNSVVKVPEFLLPSDYFDFSDSNLGWVNFKKYFLEIKNFCLQNDSRFVFVLIPTLTNLDSSYPYLDLTNNVSNYVIEHNVSLLSFFNTFSAFEPTELWVSKENTHWNDKATSLASKELTNFLLENESLR